MKNTKKRIDNSSGFVGISWHKQRSKWQARVQYKGESISLGLYEDINSAIAARELANKKLEFHEGHGKIIPAYGTLRRSKNRKGLAQ